MSNVSKGNYYKLRSKKWLESKGYSVAFLERVMWIKGQIPVKADQFGSDLLAIGNEEVIFVQVKFHKQGISEARKTFAKYPFPKSTTQWIMIWEERAREPEIVESENA